MKASERYYEILKETLENAFHGQTGALETAAQRIAESLLNGGMLYTFGTGHGHLLALEIFYRAGGLARVCPILDERLMLHASASESTGWERTDGLADELLARYPVKAGDVLIAISNSGRNTVPVELAMKCRSRGAYVIALTSLRHTGAVTPRNPMGKRLFEVADLVLDNGGALGDAAVEGTAGARSAPRPRPSAARFCRPSCAAWRKSRGRKAGKSSSSPPATSTAATKSTKSSSKNTAA